MDGYSENLIINETENKLINISSLYNNIISNENFIIDTTSTKKRIVDVYAIDDINIYYKTLQDENPISVSENSNVKIIITNTDINVAYIPNAIWN